MKTNGKSMTKKEGFSLVAVLSFMAIISAFLAMIMASASQQVFTSTRLTDQIQAKAMAEAGCEYAYSILSTDWSRRDNPDAFGSAEGTSSLSSVGDAETHPHYAIDVTTVGANAALVNSTGTCGNVSAVSIISVQDVGGSSDDGTVLDDVAFDYAILCGGTFTFTGCGTISSPGGQALFHSNGKMSLRGTVNALIDLSSHSTIKTKGNSHVYGSMTQHAPEVPIPDIDLTPYYNWALAHGEVHSGFSTSSSYTPNGGILWVDGDVMVSSHAVIHGSIIATGDIHISGQADIVPTSCAFGLVSRDGDIQVTSSGTLNGLIYAKTGGLQHTANGEIIGQIIVAGNIKKAGNSDIMAGYSQSIPAPPGGTPSTDNIVIAAWQK